LGQRSYRHGSTFSRDLAVFIPFALGMLSLEEFRKLIVRRGIPPASLANAQGKLPWTKPG
jgi:hypothetical protein